MRFLLVAVDAKYIHTNLAIRSIAAYAKDKAGLEIPLAEFTINQSIEYILEKLYESKADVIAFSCYIWNVGVICELGRELKKLLPKALFVIGGPQVSYNGKQFLCDNSAFDIVIAGEGEQTCTSLFTCLQENKSYEDITGLVFRSKNEIAQNAPPMPLSLDEVPMAYTEPEKLEGRILYYESMRGCPFGCSYCLSSIERGVRFKSLEIVYKDLAFLGKAKPRQIKFVDRTFNCNKNHALAIWRYLQETDNGVTNYHFELAGEILDEETVAYLQTVRPGLFQFEIGVQTTNRETLHAINRPVGLDKLFECVEQLHKNRNIHLHLDLIAGLPFENFRIFSESFNDVYACRPHQFQLGFLKVLSGSEMEQKAQEYGLVYTSSAPFEVLYTNWLSYSELVELKTIADMVEKYYNSGRFAAIVEYLCGCFETPFAFWQQLALFFKQNKYDEIPLSKIGYYQLLGDFMTWKKLEITDTAKWLCRYDLIRHEKPKAIPEWVDVNGTFSHQDAIMAFYKEPENIEKYLPEYSDKQSRQLMNMAHVEVFPFDPRTGEEKQCILVFNYRKRDVTGRAVAYEIELMEPKADL